MFPFWMNLMLLTVEAQQVIWLRLMRLSLGGAWAEAEAKRMVSEKIAAGGDAAARLMAGASAEQVVRRYRRKVRGNLKRLSRRR